MAAALLLLATAPAAWAQVTFNGAVSKLGTPGLTLYGPSGLTVDSAGNTYIADTGNQRIVKVSPQGNASALEMSGLNPALGHPYGLAVNDEGTLYITDPDNHRVVEVNSAGGSASVLSTGSVALSGPYGVAVDATGNVFIADTDHSRIVEVTTGGAATALAIDVSSGPTKLLSPRGLAVDTSGTLYIADSGNGRVVTVPSGSTVGSVLSMTGLGPLSNPSAVAVDGLGNIYIADVGNARIVKVTPDGTNAVLGTEPITLNDPAAVAVDVHGTAYIADAGNSQIVTAATSAVGFGHVQLRSGQGAIQSLHFSVSADTTLGAVQAFTVGAPNLDFTVAIGTTCAKGTTDTTCTVNLQFLPQAPGLRRGAVVLYGTATPPHALLAIPLYAFADAPVAALAPHTATVIGMGSVSKVRPFQIALDGSGDLYVGDDLGGKVVKVPVSGIAGSLVSTPGETMAGVTGMALDGAGNLFMADPPDNRLVVVTPGGNASALNIDGLRTGLDNPAALAFDAEGNLYVADSGNGRIVKVSSLDVAGGISSGVGSVLRVGSFSLGEVTGVAVGPAGTVYIADPGNDRVVRVTAAGNASVLNPAGFSLNDPHGVAVDGMGNIYIADSGNNRIVEITSAGMTSMVDTPGLGDPSALNDPHGVTVDASGNIFIADTNNHRVVEVPVGGASLEFPSTQVGLAAAARTATVTNLGNQPLVFAANPGYTADFSSNPGDVNLCSADTSLAAGAACDVSVEFTPHSKVSLSTGITVTNNALNAYPSTQEIRASGTALAPGDTTATTVSATPSSLSAGQATTLAAMVADTASGNTSIVPTGEVTFTDTVGSTLTSLNNGIGVNLIAGQATLAGVVLRGVGTHTITAVYRGVTNSFLTSMGSTTVTVSLASVKVKAQSPRLVFGQAATFTITLTGPYTTLAAPSGTITYSILNASSASVASGTLTLTVGSTSSTATFQVPNTLAPGSYTLNVTYSGDGNYAAITTATPVALTVNKASATVSVASSLNPVFVGNPVTFTATVSSPAGTPSGSVSFSDGQTLLASAVPLVQGVAQFTPPSSCPQAPALPPPTSPTCKTGTHSITATYAGDTDFASSSSPAFAQTVEDFTLSASSSLGSATTPTVLPGGTLNYVVQVGPSQGGIFPSAVTFTTSGLPAGATATFSPPTLAAGSPATNVNLAIQLAQQIAAIQPVNPLGRGLALAMLGGIFLLPFGKKLGRSRARAGRLAGLVLLTLAATCAALGLTACGGTRSGYFAQQPQNYTVTITATSGALSHATAVTFILE